MSYAGASGYRLCERRIIFPMMMRFGAFADERRRPVDSYRTLDIEIVIWSTICCRCCWLVMIAGSSIRQTVDDDAEWANVTNVIHFQSYCLHIWMRGESMYHRSIVFESEWVSECEDRFRCSNNAQMDKHWPYVGQWGVRDWYENDDFRWYSMQKIVDTTTTVYATRLDCDKADDGEEDIWRICCKTSHIHVF